MPEPTPSALPGEPRLWGILRPVRGQIWLAMVLAGLGAVAALAALCVLAWAVQALVETPQQWPWPQLLAAGALTALAFGLRLAGFNQAHYAAFRLETRLRAELATHLARLPLGRVQQMGAGALTKVMLDDVKALHVFVADSTPLYARAWVSPALTFALLCWLDWRLALASAAVLAIGMAVASLVFRSGKTMLPEYNAAHERISRAVVEYVQAMPVVRTFDSGSVSFGRYQQALKDGRDVVLRWYRMVGLPSRLSQLMLSPLPTLAALVWLGAWWLGRGTLDAAAWLAALLVGAGMAESLLPLVLLKQLVAKTQVSVARIVEVLGASPLPQVNVATGKQPRDASVVFDKVDFAYAPDAALALRDISFSAAPGSITALVGPSGAGKSTAVRLVARFWEVSAGRILVGGVDVREMSPEVLMRQVAFVFQDSFLFAGSIAANLRLGMPEATMEAVIAAARAAQIHDFIMHLPQGYDTPAGERGVLLSGGQRQRIAIARAILQNRPILLLDEATAFADPENEAALVAALAQLMRGKTVLMVAHRLSTIRDADQILVFDRGDLAECGSHDRLLTHSGLYARLWRNHEQAQRWVLTGAHA